MENINPSSNMGFNGNGVVDSGASTFGSSAFTNNGIQGIVAKTGNVNFLRNYQHLGLYGMQHGSTIPSLCQGVFLRAATSPSAD